MEKTKNLMYLPKSINKEITFMLYNFKNFEKLIENRKEDLIDSIKVTNVAYLKAINKSNNTLEDMIIRFDNDKVIKRYQRWKQLINLYINKLYNNNDIIAYYIIKYKYIDKRDDEFICEHLNITKEEFKFEDIRLKCELCVEAQENGLIKEVA
jgi:hypothetical protein